MTVAELVQWIAYFSLNPSGELRADWRNGQLCSLIGNMLGGKLTPNDFILHSAEAKSTESSIEEASNRAEAQCRAITMMLGLTPQKRGAPDGEG